VLGCYLLAGQPDSSRDLVDEVRKAEQLGLDAAFISERYNKKEAAVLSGAAGAVSERIRVITAATNHNTRHPMVTAGFARTMQSLTGGRFTLGLGRGVVAMQDAYGIPRITTREIEDFAVLMRRLFRGEAVFDWPGSPVLHLDSGLDEHLPLCLVAFGDKTLELAGRLFDDVVLHTYFTDEVTAHCVEVAKGAAAKAGKEIRVWSCFATIPGGLPEDVRLKKTVGRLGTYLQGYGELLVRTNVWDQGLLLRFLDDDVIKGVEVLDIVGTPEQLHHDATMIND
jgi:probable F420-dependent oxidoreductase